MLNYFRENSSSFLIKFFAGAVIVGMLFWGMSNYRARPSRLNQLQVGDAVISKEEINRKVYLVKRSGQYRGTRAQLKAAVLKSTIIELVSKQYLAAQALSIPLNVMQMSLVASHFMTPFDQKIISGWLGHTRQTREAHFKANYFLHQVKVSKQEAQAYYHVHGAHFFLQPQRARFAYVLLSQPQLKKQVRVNDVLLKDYYHLTLNRYTQPRQLQWSVYQISTAQDAPHDKGAEIDVDQLHLTAKEAQQLTGLLPQALPKKPMTWLLKMSLHWSNKQLLPESLVSKSLHLGDYLLTEYQGETGIFIVRIQGVQPEVVRPFAQVKEQVKQAYIQTQANKQFNRLVDKLGDLAFMHTDTLKPIAKALSLSIHTTPWLTKQTVSSVFKNKGQLKHAFAADIIEQKLNSNPMALDNEHSIVFRVQAYQAARVLPYKQVRHQVQQKVRSAKAFKLMLAKARQLVAAYKNGATFKALQRIIPHGIVWKNNHYKLSVADSPAWHRYIFKLAVPVQGKPSFGIFARQDSDIVRVAWLRKIKLAQSKHLTEQIMQEFAVLDFLCYQYALYLPYVGVKFASG
jgi:peptidyl-prolyl cis-trans isomerase D